jgi:hypothetical protein
MDLLDDYSTSAPSQNLAPAATRPEYVGAQPPLVRPQEDQDPCLRAAAQIKAQWIDELNQRNQDLRQLRPIVTRHRQWLFALAVTTVLSVFALALVLSWYIPLKIRTGKQALAPSP